MLSQAHGKGLRKVALSTDKRKGIKSNYVNMMVIKLLVSIISSGVTCSQLQGSLKSSFDERRSLPVTGVERDLFQRALRLSLTV